MIRDNKSKSLNIEMDESALLIMEKMAESMPGGFFIYRADDDEELIYYNKAMLRIFGCETKEEFEKLTDNSFRGIVYQEDLELVERTIREQVHSSQDNMDYVEYRIRKIDGTIRWVTDYGRLAHSPEYGDVFYVFIEDATDRMKKRMVELEEMNKELRDAYVRESQYKKAILQHAVTFFEVNLSKDCFMTTESQVIDGQVVDIFEHMGVPPVAQYSRCIDMWVSKVNEGEQAAYRQFFDIDRLVRCFHKGELEQVYEAWGIDTSGRRRLGRYSILLGRQEYTGDIIALIVCTDITDQIERQNLLQTALRQAQSANIARSAFLSNMSHDMRTPLNAIIGYANLLMNCSEDPKLTDYAKKIKNSGRELFSIVKESMEVTWVESGKAVLTETNCNIDDLLHEITADEGLMMDNKQLAFYVNSEEVRHRHIYADTVRLKEILCQLLDNAAKYTNAGGYVRLTVREEDTASDGYGQFVFVVEDNGIGIVDEFKDDIFQAFVREKNTTMSKVLGSGLGLTVVKNFVDMMEGTIDVDSQVGVGSTFTVRILFKLSDKNQTGSVEQQVLERSSLAGKRILLVEDNELNAEIAEELLKRSGFVIETAENGQVAVEKVKNSMAGYYCCVLMDIQMPVMDGYEASRRIRKLEDQRLANIPIIALSANAFSEDHQRSIESGMDAHFPKPIEIEGLVDLMCRVLAKGLY